MIGIVATREYEASIVDRRKITSFVLKRRVSRKNPNASAFFTPFSIDTHNPPNLPTAKVSMGAYSRPATVSMYLQANIVMQSAGKRSFEFAKRFAKRNRVLN
jgi:hypothetical protein